MSVKERNRVQGLQPELEEYYRWFHRHPEPSYGEVKTTARIKEILTVHGIEFLDTGLKPAWWHACKARRTPPRIWESVIDLAMGLCCPSFTDFTDCRTGRFRAGWCRR